MILPKPTRARPEDQAAADDSGGGACRCPVFVTVHPGRSLHTGGQPGCELDPERA